MIKKLKRRFIFTSLCSVLFVLILIIGSINVVNYSQVIDSANMRLDMLQNGGGRAPMIDIHGNKGIRLSPEAPFDIRFFSVYFDLEGNIIGTNTDNIAAIDDDTAKNMAKRLLDAGKTEGITKSYAYRVIPIENRFIYLFIDHSRELDTFFSFLTASILISIIAFTLVSVLIVVFSGKTIKPIAESYNKQKRFITDAGHELKTPLSVIKAANEVIEIEHGESKWTKSINNQVIRLTELTDKLVLLSRMSEDNGLNFTRFSLSETLNECISYFEAVEFSGDKEIHTDISENITFFGDEKAIAQLFTLLTDNALKYSPEGSIINVCLRKSPRETEIVFLNPAENIPQGNNNILFERFYRHDSSRNSEMGGHGIGLAAAKAIVDAHKGRISADNPDGKSFRITVTLPNKKE